MNTADKIKQRLVGLLGVGIILLAFVPVIIEDPPTYLEVLPTRVPLAPVVASPTPLFEGFDGRREQIQAQVSRERLGYAESLAAASQPRPAVERARQVQGAEKKRDLNGAIPNTEASALLAPLEFLGPRAGRVTPAEAGDLLKGHALSQAWVVVLRRHTERAILEAERDALMAQRIPSFVVPLSARGILSASKATAGASRDEEKNQANAEIAAVTSAVQSPQDQFLLLVGPELRREDAVKRMAQLQTAYPDATLSIEAYFPGRLP